MNIDESLYKVIREEVQFGDNTLEFGSGLSSFAFLEEYSTHIAVESNKQQHSVVNSFFGYYSMCSYRPLDPNTGWYKPLGFHYKARVILIDGPWSREGSRRGCIEDVKRHSTPDSVIFVDDIHRDAEKAVLNLLAFHFNREPTVIGRWARI